VTARITQRTARLCTAALRAACAVAFAFAAQQAAAQPPAAAGKTVVYRTQAGDTLYDVAARYLQGADDWQLLQQINGVPAPKRLQPGIALKLPVARLRKEKLTARVIAVQGTAERASGDAFAPLANDATLAEGDRVRIRTSTGAVEAIVHIDDKLREDVVDLPSGHVVDVMAILPTDRLDSFAGTPAANGLPCVVERV